MSSFCIYYTSKFGNVVKKEDLKIGDRILFVTVPVVDMQEKHGLSEEDGGDTVGVLTQLIDNRTIVIIDDIDEYGQAWFSIEVELDGVKGEHSLAVIDDESWVRIDTQGTFDDPAMQQLSDKIAVIMTTYESEYDALAQESEALYEAKIALQKKYEALDERTGLSKLFHQMGFLHNQNI